MNKILNKLNLLNRIRIYIKNNIKNIIISIIIVLVVFISTQLYFYYQERKVLKSSIDFEIIKSSNFDNKYDEVIKRISKENNFYAVLTILEQIKFKLENNEIDQAYSDYIDLISRKNLDSIYQTTIAINASYSFLNILSNYRNKPTDINDLLKKIDTLLGYVDPTIESFKGHHLEIQYLLTIIQNENDDNKIKEETQKLYDEIMQHNMISTSLKERVKKIHDFQAFN